MKPIDGHAMIRRVETLHKRGVVDLSYYNIVKEAVQMEPSVDAVPVVRCKDCRWWNGSTLGAVHICAVLNMATAGEFYCATAERKKQ